MNEERQNYLHFLFGFSYSFLMGNEIRTNENYSDFDFSYTVLGLVDTQLKDMALEKMTKKEAEILIKAHYWMKSFGEKIQKLK